MNLVFATDNGGDVQTSLGPGVCMAMTCDWIAKTKAKGRVESRNDLMGNFALGIAQSSYQIGHTATDHGMIERFDLRLRWGGERTRSAGLFSSKKKRLHQAAAELATASGYVVVAIQGDKGGHAMGYRLTSAVPEFFDPNEGLWRFDDVFEFNGWFARYVLADYPDLTKEVTLYYVM